MWGNGMMTRTGLCRTAGALLLAGVAWPALAQDDRVPAPRAAPMVFAPVTPRELATGPDSPDMQREVRDLREAIRLTYWGNPTILSQRATVRSTDNRYPAARAAYGLTLSAEATHGYQRDRVQTPPAGFVGSQGWSTVATAILNQPLFTFGRASGGEKVALAQIAFARDTLRLNETQTLLGAITAYISVIRDRQAVSIARQNLALLDRQLGDSRERFRVREITSSDLQQIETRVELGRAQLIQAEGQLGATEAQFVQLVGAQPGDLASPDALVIPVASLEQAYDTSDTRSPVIRAAQSREKISRATVQALKAEFGPRIDARGTATYDAVSPYSNNLRTTQLRGEIVLSMPLLDANLRLSRQREAEQANAADWRLIDQAVRDAHASIASNWKQMAASRAALDNFQLAIDAAQKAYDGAVIQEKAGARTTLDVLDLARDLLNVRNSYNAALANEYIGRANVLAAMGLLEAPELVPDIDRYDPAIYYDQVDGRGDLPLVTDVLFGLDRAVSGQVSTDRAIVDPGAQVRVPETRPLQPPRQP